MRKIMYTALIVVVALAGCTSGCAKKNPMNDIDHPIPSDAPITLTVPPPTPR